MLFTALASGFVGDRWSEFKQPQTSGTVNRLSNVNSSERYLVWKSAVEASSSERLTVIGPGTFEYWWTQQGGGSQFVRNAHSIYLESLAEMGPVGLIPVLALILWPFGIAVVLALGGGSEIRRGLSAAAGMAAFAVAAGIDWAWELTVLPVLFFVLAVGVGDAISRPDSSETAASRFDPPGWGIRIRVAAGAVLAVILIAVRLAGTSLYRASQSSISSDDLTAALDRARQASSVLPYLASARTQEAQVLDLLSRRREAISAARQATQDEPDNWRNWFVLSAILAESSPDRARAAGSRARSLNPRSVSLEAATRNLTR